MKLLRISRALVIDCWARECSRLRHGVGVKVIVIQVLNKLILLRGSQKVRFSIFYLEYKQVTVSDTWLRYRHIFILFFDVIAIHFEALVITVDQKTKPWW
jgi:hypothetical protein